jgi:hypothetical protein
MDQQLESLSIQLANTTIRNTAGAVADRIQTAKARKKDQETIAELEDIVYSLIADKSELARIAQAYEEELVAQKIAPSDIEYISTNLVPLVEQIIQASAASPADVAAQQNYFRLIQPLLAVETVTLLQLIGFNFKRAIGEPLTELVSKLILSRIPSDPALPLELQRAYLSIAQDPEAHARLLGMVGEATAAESEPTATAASNQTS